MKNIKKFNISEIEIALLEIFDEETAKEMLKTYSYEELICIIEKEKVSIIDTDISVPDKHLPSRKKKANRIKKPTTEYKKSKKKKWIEKRRTNIPNDETSSRSYLNKASKGYTKLHPHVKVNSKNQNKKS